MHAPKIFTFFLTLLVILGINGCSHYSIISVDNTPFESVYVHTISNQDFAPNIHTLFQNQVRQTILRDARLKLAKTPQEARVQLYITIEDYRRIARTRSSIDAGRFNSLNLGLTIVVSLYDNESNAYLLKDVPIESNEILFINPLESLAKQRETEYQLLPTITRNLSENILELILSYWS